eukprot:364884-Chlamydomonas_euryale.AAC.5
MCAHPCDIKTVRNPNNCLRRCPGNALGSLGVAEQRAEYGLTLWACAICMQVMPEAGAAGSPPLARRRVRRRTVPKL